MVEEDLWFAIPVTGMLRECKVSRLELQETELVGGWALTAFTLLAPKPGFLSSWGPILRISTAFLKTSLKRNKVRCLNYKNKTIEKKKKNSVDGFNNRWLDTP